MFLTPADLDRKTSSAVFRRTSGGADRMSFKMLPYDWLACGEDDDAMFVDETFLDANVVLLLTDGDGCNCP